MTDQPPLVAKLDFGSALEAVEAAGAAFVPRALDRRFRRRLQFQLEGAPFVRLPDQIGPVRQEADLFVTRGAMTDLPAVAELRDDLVRRLADLASSNHAVSEWYPNEAYVQRYAPSKLGVSPHLDSARFAHLIAVFTSAGSARFAMCRDRSGDPIMEWNAGPGSLVLLRGASSWWSDRPFHTVKSPVTGLRFSVTLRMNTHPG